MLKRASSKKKRWITVPIVGVLTATIVAGVLYNTSETASARVSLSGIEEINQGNSLSDPFVVLEIVPSYDQAKIGYLVNGEEPAYFDNNKGVLALADMGSETERDNRYTATEVAKFDKFSSLEGKAFEYDAFDKTGSGKSFTTYGKFVLKSETTPSSDYDYVDRNKLSSAYKLVKAPTTVEADKPYTLEEILKTINTETTGEVYDNEIAYEFAQPNTKGYIPDFAKVVKNSSPEFYPYATDVDGSGTNYYDWNYYRPTVIEVTEEEDSDNPGNYIYSSNVDLRQFLPIYVAADGDTSKLDFLGITKTATDNTTWLYKDIKGTAYDQTLGASDDETSYQAALANLYANYFKPDCTFRNTNPDAVFVYMSEYVSYEASSIQDLYYISSITFDADYGFATYTLTDYNLRIFAGQDPTQYGIALDDPLDYHEFFYRLGNAGEEYQYVAGTSDKDIATHDFVSNYTEDVNETFSYDDGFTNNEVFKKYVLDRDAGAQCNETIIDVVTRTYADVTTTDIANADLIYVNGGIYSADKLISEVDPAYKITTAKDISGEAAKAILAAVKEDKAIVVEAQALYNLSNDDTNAHKLAIALSQDSIADTNIDAMYNAFDDTDFADTYKATHSETGDYTKRTVFVTPSTKNTYVDVICDEDASAEYKMAFTKTITGEDRLAGYKDVVTDINNEVFYLKVVYGESGYKTLGFNEKVSYGTIFRHILNYGNRRVTTKNSYRVLDIEPGYSQTYEDNKSLFGLKFYGNNNGGTYTLTQDGFKYSPRDIFDKDWFINNVCEKGNAPTVTVTGMSTREFVGNITDLNANYDLIYVGLDTMYLNTSKGTATVGGINYEVKSKNTIYNDSTMDGLVYTHVGDIMSYGVGRANKNDSGINTGSSYRTGGNDLTFEKLRDLQSYVEAGYAVLLSNDFFTYDSGKVTGINTKKIDPNSYMYDFAKLCLYGVNYVDEQGVVHTVDIDKAMNDKDFSHGYMGKNVNIVKDLDKEMKYTFDVRGNAWTPNEGNLSFGASMADNKENFVNYLNIQKLDIEVYSQPVQYYDKNDKDKKVYLAARNGNYYLEYEVELINKAAVGTPSYDCKLYIDVDADGRFTELEAQDLTDITTSGGAPATKVNGKFTLSTGTRYYISMMVPDDFKGFLSWKLEFIENDRQSSTGVDLVKKAVTGYSAVLDHGAKTTIKVLQLTSITNSYGQKQNHLDLTSTSMKNLYNQVQDFNIDVKAESVGDFVENVPNENKLKHLMDYDMIVMGFSDCYSMPISGPDGRDTYEAVYAIREYILSGRSMLFTHDLNSPYYFEKQSVWGCFLNEFIRELQGMDRYGMTEENIARLEEMTGKKCTEYKSRYDDDDYKDLWGKQSTKVTNSKFNLNTGSLDKLGILYGQFGKYRNNNELGDVSDFELRRLQQDNDAKWEYNFASKKVSMVNEGQITDYPFYIGESLDIAATHPQYFQLNLDTDSQDTNMSDDIVVWYCIDGMNNGQYSSYYTMDRNDARNNYYIYNKGNITYTGSGHATIGETQVEERKLFVNTMVAAYSAAKHAPVISYKESAWNQSATIGSIYEPYDVNLDNGDDEAEGGALGNTVTVNFKVINNNLKNNKELDAETNTYKFKKINVEYYVADTNGAYTINNTKVSKISAADIKLYMKVDSTGNVLNTPVEIKDDIYSLENGAIYTAEIKNSYFLKTSSSGTGDDEKLVLDSHSGTLYIRASMETMAEMLTPTDAKASTIIPSTESFNALTVNYTELYELR